MLEALVLTVMIAAPDTSFVAAEDTRDLTGDGVEEVLLLQAFGDPADSLEMTLTIRSEGREVYRDSFIVDRVIGFDAGRRVASDAEWAEVLRFYRDAFAPTKFTTLSELLSGGVISRRALIERTRLTEADVDTLVASDPTVFMYSPGGDAAYFVTWDPGEGRFYNLFACC